MRARAIGIVAVAVLFGGCSPLSPPHRPARSGSLTSAARTAVHEVPTPHRPQSAPGSAGPELAIVAFTEAYVNWTATSVTADMRALAAASIGQARSTMELAAAETAGDYELRRGGIANHGAVEAVAPVRGRPGRYAVVTLESTTASHTDAYQGLRPAWHVTVATVTRLAPGQWVISGWQPEG
jgi:hypothetical protein